MHLCSALSDELLDFSNFSLKRGFLSLKARLAPFLHLARVSEYPLSELGTLSAGRDKRLIERADDALSAQMLLRFSQLAKRVECLAYCMILAKRTSLA